MSKNDEDVAPGTTIAATMKDIKKGDEPSGNFDSGIEEESIMDRLSNLKLISDDVEDNNNNKCVKQDNTTGDKDGNSEKENSVSANEKKLKELAIDGEKCRDCDVAPGNKENSKSPKGSQSPQSPGHVSPAEFFRTSRLRCSALANKLNTTQTFGGSVEPSQTESETSSPVDEITKGVESVILNEKKEEVSSEKKDGQGEEKSTKSDDKQEERELIDRSPVPGYTINRNANHPYQQPQQQARYPNSQASPSRGYYPMKVDDATSYSPAYYMEQQRYKAGAQPGFYPPRQQPQAVPSPTYFEYGNYNNNAMWSPPNGYCPQQQVAQDPAMNNQYNQQGVACEQPIDISPPSSVINSLADMCHMVSSKSPLAVLSPFSLSPSQPTDTAKTDGLNEEKSTTDVEATDKQAPAAAGARELAIEELPDELCDFILTYSRHYTAKNDLALDKSSPGSVANDGHGEHRSTPGTPATVSSGYETASTDGRSPASVHDGSSSVGDMTFSPAFYTNSPNAYSPQQARKGQESPVGDDTSKQSPTNSARNRLREQIDQKDLDSALAWAMRCCQSRPEALFFRDKDGDSLLHIVIWHKDLAKIYVLTEIILKSTPGGQGSAPKLFDLPNKQNETPLFLAVEKGLTDVVTYLLECGADPNVCPSYRDADPPLHYAAARGMADIVQTLCTGGRGVINILNAVGMTPLLCAVKNHGNLDAESQSMVDNTVVIKTLLKAGADASIQDASSGKNVLHFCVERMDPALIQLFGDHLERNTMARLVDSCDYNGYTPLSLVSGPALIGTGGPDDEKLRQKMSKLLLEYSVGQNLSADDFGDLSYLLSDQVPGDGVQFTVLDTYLSSQAY